VSYVFPFAPRRLAGLRGASVSSVHDFTGMPFVAVAIEESAHLEEGKTPKSSDSVGGDLAALNSLDYPATADAKIFRDLSRTEKTINFLHGLAPKNRNGSQPPS
jgi:hypothetical protein